MHTVELLSFLVQPLEGERVEVLTITPVLSGISLTQLIEDFERERDFQPVGGYGGLVPQFFRYGPLNLYFMGESKDAHCNRSGFYLLGCNCGEVGCWPLTARITNAGVTVVAAGGSKLPITPF
jgi:hypothetical protein